MRKTTRGLGLILLATLALSGCSLTIPGQPTKTSTEKGDSTVEPASGDEIAGPEYTYNAPEGWGEYEYPREPKPETFMVNLEDTDELTDNFNTISSPAGRLTPDQIETQGVAEFDTLEGAEVKINERVQIAGSESVHFTVRLKNAEGEYVIEQYYPTSEDATYVASFTFSSDVSEADRMKVVESTLASWVWK